VHWAPGIPHALYWAEEIQSSGDSRRGNADLYLGCLKIEFEYDRATPSTVIIRHRVSPSASPMTGSSG
jgi:hypothetical protein